MLATIGAEFKQDKRSFCTVIGVGVITFVGCLSVVAFSLSLGLDFASEPRRLEDEQRQQTAAL